MSEIIEDGQGATIILANAPTGGGPGITFKEKSITPPGLDGGGEIDTTTLRNTLYRTKKPKTLLTISTMSLTVTYESSLYDEILTMLNVNQLITVNFPDGSSVAFWGWLNSFKPGSLEEGTQPTADIEIIPSNQNDSSEETGPDWSDVPTA